MTNVLKIEPLKEILEMYSDKNQVFIDYMNNKVLQTIEGSIFYEENIDQLFIYDKIYCIDKSTLKVAHIGQIIYYSKDDITIKIKSRYYMRINHENYYIFYKRKLKKNSKKDFMISLLKLL
jgi:hypothetical protein